MLNDEAGMFVVFPTTVKSPSNKNDKSSSSSEDKKYTGKAPASSKEYLELLTNPDLSIEEKASVKEQYRDQFS